MGEPLEHSFQIKIQRQKITSTNPAWTLIHKTNFVSSAWYPAGGAYLESVVDKVLNLST